VKYRLKTAFWGIHDRFMVSADLARFSKQIANTFSSILVTYVGFGFGAFAEGKKREYQ
jgi:hypothetical protein